MGIWCLKSVSVSMEHVLFPFCIKVAMMETLETDLIHRFQTIVVRNLAQAHLHVQDVVARGSIHQKFAISECWWFRYPRSSRRNDGIAMKAHKLIQHLELVHLNRPQIASALYHTTQPCIQKLFVNEFRLSDANFTKKKKWNFNILINRCLFVFGFHSAIAVSLNGLKKIEPSCGFNAKPIPCDDFLPTKRIGNSAPNGKGPARSALVFTENSLQ